MRIQVSLDCYDGSKSQTKEIDAEDFQVRELMWRLMEADVCGFTVTTLDKPIKLMKKMDKINEGEE